MDYSKATLSQIAAAIAIDWRAQGKGINYGAKPYLEAMYSLTTINDNYGSDSGRSVVNYFLSNAGTWKGKVAKAIKTELKKRLK